MENLVDYEMIFGIGGGICVCYVYSVGVDLGLFMGVLSVLGIFVSM